MKKRLTRIITVALCAIMLFNNVSPYVSADSEVTADTESEILDDTIEETVTVAEESVDEEVEEAYMDEAAEAAEEVEETIKESEDVVENEIVEEEKEEEEDDDDVVVASDMTSAVENTTVETVDESTVADMSIASTAYAVSLTAESSSEEVTVQNSWEYDTDTANSVITLTKYTGSATTFTIPKTTTIDGVSYEVQFNLSDTGVLKELKFEDGYDLSASINASYVSNGAEGLAAHLLFNPTEDTDCALKTIDVSNVKYDSASDIRGLFYGLTSVEEIKLGDLGGRTDFTSLQALFYKSTALKSVDLSGVTFTDEVSLKRMCYGCTALETVIFPESIKVSDASDVFYNNTSLTSVNVNTWDLSGCTLLTEIFYGCSSLASVDVSTWDVSNAVKMFDIFYGCSSLTSVDVSNWEIPITANCDKMFVNSGVTELEFNNCGFHEDSQLVKSTSVKKIVLNNCTFGDLYYTMQSDALEELECNSCVFNGDNFDSCMTYTECLVTAKFINCSFPSATSFNDFFRSLDYLKEVQMINCDASLCTDLSGIFRYCYQLTSVDFTGSTFGAIDTLAYAFFGTRITKVDLSPLDLSSLRLLTYAFYECIDLTEVYFGEDVNLSSLTNLYYAFAHMEALESIDFGETTFENVEYANHAFSYSCSLKSINAPNAVFGSCRTFANMFSGCCSLESLDLSNWDVTSAKSFDNMFNYCYSLKDLSISEWEIGGSDTSNVSFASMFYACYSLTSLDLSEWDTQYVDNVDRMFFGCSGLTSLDLSNWDISLCESFRYTFSGLDMNVIDLSNWKFSENADLEGIFYLSDIKTIITPDCSNLGDVTVFLITNDDTNYLENLNAIVEYYNTEIESVQVSIEQLDQGEPERLFYELEKKYYETRLKIIKNILNSDCVLYRNTVTGEVVPAFTSDTTAGQVLTRLCVKLYADKEKTQLLITEYPAYSTSVTYTTDAYNAWFDCDTDERVSLLSITESINAYGKYLTDTTISDDDSTDDSNSSGSDSNSSGSDSNNTSDSDSSESSTSSDGSVNKVTESSMGETTESDTTSESTSSSSENTDNSSTASTSSETVKTGDNNNLILLVCIVMIGIVAIITGGYYRKRKTDK